MDSTASSSQLIGLQHWAAERAGIELSATSDEVRESFLAQVVAGGGEVDEDDWRATQVLLGQTVPADQLRRSEKFVDAVNEALDRFEGSFFELPVSQRQVIWQAWWSRLGTDHWWRQRLENYRIALQQPPEVKGNASLEEQRRIVLCRWIVLPASIRRAVWQELEEQFVQSTEAWKAASRAVITRLPREVPGVQERLTQLATLGTSKQLATGSGRWFFLKHYLRNLWIERPRLTMTSAAKVGVVIWITVVVIGLLGQSIDRAIRNMGGSTNTTEFIINDPSTGVPYITTDPSKPVPNHPFTPRGELPRPIRPELEQLRPEARR